MATVQQSYPSVKERASRWIAPLLFLIGLSSILSGLLTVVLVGVMPGVALFLCGVAAIAAARIVELLMAIETDLSAIRTRLDLAALGELAADVSAIRNQMGMGVFGLLGAPPKR